MPEFGPRNKAFETLRKDKILPMSGKRGDSLPARAFSFLQKHKIPALGHGMEHVVVPYGENKVAALTKYEKDELLSFEMQKATFYSHKILTILFPQNFPNFHAKFFQPVDLKDSMGEGTVRERKNLRGEPSGQDQQDFFNKLRELEEYVPIRRTLDTIGDNLFYDEKGNVVYTDELWSSFILEESHVARLEEYMKKKNYSPSDISRALRFAARAAKVLRDRK